MEPSTAHELRSSAPTTGAAIAALLALALAVLAALAPELAAHALAGAASYVAVVACCAALALALAAALVDEREFELRLAAAFALFPIVAGSAVTLLGFARLLSLPWLLALLGVAAALAYARGPQPWLVAGLRRCAAARPSWPAALAFALFAATWAFELSQVLRYTPQESDAMWYHLPMVAHWVQSGAIELNDSIPLIARAYPGLRQAALAALTLPLGNEHLAFLGLVELPALFFVLLVAVRRAGASSDTATALASYGASMPVVLHAATSQGTDLSLATYLLLALLALRDALASGSLRSALLAGLALGAESSLKYSGPIYAVLVVSACVLEFVLGRPRAQWLAAARPRTWIVLAIGALLIAGPWYGRNLVLFGNPLYPAPFLGLPGPFDRSELASKTLGWNVAPLIEAWRHFPAANGWLVPLMLIAPLALLAALALRRRRAAEQLAVPVLAVLCFVAFLHQPFNRPSFQAYYNMRYLIGWSALLLVACGALWRGPSLAWIALLATASNFWHLTRWAPQLAVSALVGALALRWAWAPGVALLAARARALAPLAWALSLGLVLAAASLRSRLQYDAGYGYRDSASDSGWAELGAWAHRHLSGAAIGIHGDTRTFPYYGDRLDNRVVALEAAASPAQLAAAAREQGLDWLVCIAPIVGRRSSREFEFGPSLAPALLAQHPELFQLERQARGSHLLRVVR